MSPAQSIERGPGAGVLAPLDLDALETCLPDLGTRYRGASPFPHIALDGFLHPEVAWRAQAEFPPVDHEQWINYVHANERKFSNTDPETWAPTLRSIWSELTSERFLRFLGELTGIDGLITDDSLEGAGLHQTRAGGFLNIHADFTVHPRIRNWRRRVNVLVYLNDPWPVEYGGDLELWSRDMVTREHLIAPIGNRAVIFTTGAETWHGHPDPLRCPPDTARRSLAVYYYTDEEEPLARSTEYRARPGDGAKAVKIYVDNEAVRAYDWLRRRLGLSDHATGRLLGALRRSTPPGAERTG